MHTAYKVLLQLLILSSIFLCFCLAPLSAGTGSLLTTESDPDAFIERNVNVINGQYCESVTDLVIPGPDPLILQPWRFAEKRFDPYSRLILFGLRLYDPTIGRWLSQDPAGLIDGPNLYAYLHNNPLNHIDRFGLATESHILSKFTKYFYGEVEVHCYCETHRTCKRGGDLKDIAASSTLPKIIYDDFFEKFHKDYRSKDLVIKDFYALSTCFDLSEEGLPELPNGLGVGCINGVWKILTLLRQARDIFPD